MKSLPAVVLPLRFQPGDTLMVRTDEATPELWQVVQRKMSGWLLKPLDGGDPRTWSDDEINDAHVGRRLIHRPCSLANLPAVAAEAMERTWEFWAPGVRRQAERRLEYVKAAQALLDDGALAMDAYAMAADRVHAEFAARWATEDRDAATAEAAVAAFRTRRREAMSDPPSEIVRPFAKPNPFTIRRWHKNWNANGRDVRLLLPHHHLRGNRTMRFPTATATGSWDTYRCMSEAVERAFMDAPRRRADYAYRFYVKLCKERGVAQVASATTFRTTIGKMVDDRQRYSRDHGSRAAHLKFDIFQRTKLPERPLEEVEVDHCLIDLFVVDPVTGKALYRPWLTAIVDRATKAILGAHMSSWPPSYATVMRAMAHAMWPKNLEHIPGLLHDWPCHGVWDMLFTDNGKEFHSNSLKVSSALLGFTIVPLPAKRPWLKGTIERLWNRMGVQVYSLQEGTTQARAADHYDPMRRAEKTLDDVRALTLQWIVNEYHQERHATLGCSPMQRWLELTSLYPVRPVPDFEHVIRLTGEVVQRTIQNTGVRIDGQLYADVDPVTGGIGRKLATLRSRNGGLERVWTIRRDPFDIGEIWILDDLEGEWISLPNTEPGISKGVSRWAHKQHLKAARQNVPPGTQVTVSDIARAAGDARREANDILAAQGPSGAASKASRYLETPTYLTPLPFPLQPTPSTPPSCETAPPVAPTAEAKPPRTKKARDRAMSSSDIEKLISKELEQWG